MKKDFEDFDQILDEEKKVDPTNPCDPSHPDYPWVPCGLNDKEKKDKE
ncbi:MAG: hypothetical protein ACRC28_13410 [Clostridium sp.]